MLCPKCGSQNAPGDAFCGNCGAFLEFAAEEAAEGTVPGAAAPVGAAAAAEAGAGADGASCAICGRANPAGRRFCITCGERLPASPAGRPDPAPVPTAGAAGGPGAVPMAPAEPLSRPNATVGVAAPVAADTPGSPGPRPAAPDRPAWDFPAAPVPAPLPSPAATGAGRGEGGRGRGGPSAPVVAGILVLLFAVVGGGALLVLNGLPNGGPGAPAGPATPGVVVSAEPSAAPAAAATAEPDATAVPTAAPTSVPTPAPTIPPGPSVGLAITGSKASSQLKADRGPKYLFDGSPATTWKSASGRYTGAWVEVRFAPAAVTRIQVWSGWQKSEPLFFGNHRPHNVTVSFDGGQPVPLELEDVMGAQRVDIPSELGIVRATRVRITIADVYPAKKTSAADSPTTQVAISEIRLFGVPVTP
ncbi:MAG: zinc-ribbon domain-containing protein [Chloroflexi bacterium]|nr:zinc-ribbon domain-containing protein [Chloroflexota bacterium]